MKNIIGQMTDELGELGKQIVKEIVKAPVDIAAQVFEKGGTTKPKQTGKTPLDEIGETSDEKVKRGMARRALEYVLRGKQQHEPSVYEKKMMEEREKKEHASKQAAARAWQSLPNTGAAAKRGDPRNVAKKQSGAETSRNVRND